eukprot:TRINITY_DN51779_c0_g1_i1.p1 TRINITY_DN51779_c0_g1~~TRINITY_DN51779_c0_g1_i1.p1  ORF type:complete len:330 (-),score=79.45 TRINITY_DN51779_c0_g1_i1:61-1050(-)
MGRKDDAPKGEEKEEDTPVVKELKSYEDQYLELERQYEAEVHAIQMEYEAKQKPFLDERTQRLAAAGNKESVEDSGTPALPGFWTQALKNHPSFEDMIQEWDEPVLAYLRDITCKQLTSETPYKDGFKLLFDFAPNPYFEPNQVTKEYHFKEGCPYRGEVKVSEIKCTEIEWKSGKDVTVEKVQKKVKGGGAKKNKQKKEKDTPRDSFFRKFFRNLKSEEPLPEDLMQILLQGAEIEDLDDEDMDIGDEFMSNDSELASALKDQVIPFAIRWYTGEASPEDDDTEEEEESESEEESEEEEEKPKRKPAKAKSSPKTGPAHAPKEDCKQQ